MNFVLLCLEVESTSRYVSVLFFQADYFLSLMGVYYYIQVYAGCSSNILNRHANNYQKHGSHLLSYFESCLRRGYTIMRRVKYCKTAEKAKALESRLLNLWDYPWNKLENGNIREVFLQANLCLCFTTSVTVKSNDNKRSRIQKENKKLFKAGVL